MSKNSHEQDYVKKLDKTGQNLKKLDDLRV